MNRMFVCITCVVCLMMLTGAPLLHAQEPLGSGFSYQGQLKLGGVPLSDTADFDFTLFDALEGGSQVGATVAADGVDVVNGLFTVELDFGADAFNGDARWLEIAVRSPAGSGDFTMLWPRQPLTATPYALQTRGLFVDDVGKVGIGTVTPATELDVAGTVTAADVDVAADLHVHGMAAFGTGARNWRIREVSPDDPEGWSDFIQYEGIGIRSNTGTDHQMVMFTDASPVDPMFTVASSTNSGVAWSPRLVVLQGGKVGIGTDSPATELDVVGTVTATAFEGDGSGLTGLPAGSLWGQSGSDVYYNAGNVGIGTNDPTEMLDVASNIHASGTITSGSSITIDGASGSEKITSSADLDLHVSSGRALRIEADATSPNLIGGYSGNTVTAGVIGASIGGGGNDLKLNSITDDYGTIGGGYGNQVGDGAGTTSDAPDSTVGGGKENEATAPGSTVGGGVLNEATGIASTVGGGLSNKATGSQSTVAGGNLNEATADYSTVGGGLYNKATGYSSTVGGGRFNEATGNSSFAAGCVAKANHDGAFVWADSNLADFASTDVDQFLIQAAGGVGIGTNAPTEMLDVAGTVKATAFERMFTSSQWIRNACKLLFHRFLRRSGSFFLVTTGTSAWGRASGRCRSRAVSRVREFARG